MKGLGTRRFAEVLVGLCGGSCAGKTTLARALLVERPDATLLEFDDYYHDLSAISVEERAKVNYDHPDALDIQLLLTHMDELAAGRAVDVPDYDFATHTRPGGLHRVEASALVIVDGLLLLALAECRERLDLKVFVDAPREVRLARRLEKDVRDRGRDREGVIRQFGASVEPMHETLVFPSSEFADVCFTHPFDVEHATQVILGNL
jgi:uridine kinase|tara:strand:- start:1013 stop:1630 length:618 start_codon:yes stop_codon:yes gene_type:complete